jgi:transposase, IS5 family
MCSKSHFGYKFHRIIERDYELIRKFKITILSLHISQVDLSKNNEVVLQRQRILRSIIKGYDSTIKQVVK